MRIKYTHISDFSGSFFLKNKIYMSRVGARGRGTDGKRKKQRKGDRSRVLGGFFSLDFPLSVGQGARYLGKMVANGVNTAFLCALLLATQNGTNSVAVCQHICAQMILANQRPAFLQPQASHIFRERKSNSSKLQTLRKTKTRRKYSGFYHCSVHTKLGNEHTVWFIKIIF